MVSRRSSATAETLESHKVLIETATGDLQERLESIDEKLEAIIDRTVTGSAADSMELRLMEEEKLSTQRCLQICHQLSAHINQIQPPLRRRTISPGLIDSETVPENVINEGLQNCRDNLILTATKLERHMRDIMDQMVAKSRSTTTSKHDAADLARLQEEWETASTLR